MYLLLVLTDYQNIWLFFLNIMSYYNKSINCVLEKELLIKVIFFPPWYKHYI